MVTIEPLLSAGEAVGVVVALAALLLGALAIRRRVLQRRWSCFEASVRLVPKPMGRGWVLGLGCYDADLLRWYRMFSFRMQPRVVLDRRTLEVTGARCPRGPEARALLAGSVVLTVSDGDRQVELGVGEAARTHLTAWVETASRDGARTLGDGARALGDIAPALGDTAPALGEAAPTPGETAPTLGEGRRSADGPGPAAEPVAGPGVAARSTVVPVRLTVGWPPAARGRPRPQSPR